MSSQPFIQAREPERAPASSIVIVGADGFVGGCLAEALGAQRVVYGPVHEGDVHVGEAEGVVRAADVVINAGGFRVRPGCDYADYQRSHLGATARLVPWIRKGALLVHFSSSSVLGRSKTRALGNDAPPDPQSFPSPWYAQAKLEADRYLEAESAQRGFRVVFLRPAVIYGPSGAGMIETLLKFARRGFVLRLYPRGARHHLCHTDLLAEVVRRVIEQQARVPNLSRLVVADPYTVTNAELESMVRRFLPHNFRTVYLHVGFMSFLLRHSFRSRNPKLDFKTWGEILGVMNLDTAYDPSATFRLLGIDPARYAPERTLRPVIEQGLL